MGPTNDIPQYFVSSESNSDDDHEFPILEVLSDFE
jgi:hypothetical protein